MSETTTSTPTPADVAAKEPAQVAEPEQTKADETDWKAEARKWEQRAKENKAAAEEASKTAEERAADRLAAIERRAAEAEARVIRREVALDHKLSKDDAALLDTVTDEKAMRALAARLAAEVPGSKHNIVPREGNNNRPGKSDSSWGPVLQQLDRQRQA